MVTVSRQPRPLVRSEGTLRDARLIVIATEGSVTEKIYFDAYHSSKVQVKVVPSASGKSSPKHVLANLDAFKAAFELEDDDELWLVIDRDRWTPQALSSVAKRCVANGYSLGLSNPCFELWLALHFPQPLPAVLNAQTLRNTWQEFSVPTVRTSSMLRNVWKAWATQLSELVQWTITRVTGGRTERVHEYT